MSNEKKKVVIMAIVLAIVVIAAIYMWFNYCQKATDSLNTTVMADTITVIIPTDSLLVDSLKNELLIRQRIIDECGKKIPVYRDRIVRVQPPPTTIYTPPPPPPTKKTPTETKISVTPQNGLDQIFYENGSKNIFFCLRLGGSADRHLPHLAMLNGENFGNSRNNNQSGFNWEVAPGQLSDGFLGEYGVTKDGTFYVSQALVERYLSASDNGLVEIKTTVTGWSPKTMKISGDFYIYKK